MWVIISPARNYFLNKKSRKKVELAWRNRIWAVRKLVRSLLLVPRNRMQTLSASLLSQHTRKKPYTVHRTEEDLLQQRSQNWYRQTCAVVHWDTIKPKLLRAFADRGSRDLSENNWIGHIHEGSNKTRFEYCEDSKNSWLVFEQFKTHKWNYFNTWTDGARHNSLWLERVCVPQGLFLQHQLHPWERTHCRRKTEQKRQQTIFFTPHNPSGENPDEENPVTTCQHQGRCTISVTGNMIKMPCFG